MSTTRLMGVVCACAVSLITATAHATYYQRGDGTYFAVYDDVLDVTWGGVSGYLFWQDAADAAADSTYGGSDTWRLPTDSELTSLYNTPIIGYNYYDLPNIGFGLFWSSVEPVFINLGPSLGCAPPSLPADCVDSGTLSSHPSYLGSVSLLEVMSGDIATIPVPAAAWLFGSGFLGLIGIARRKKAA